MCDLKNWKRHDIERRPTPRQLEVRIVRVVSRKTRETPLQWLSTPAPIHNL